MRAIAAAPSPLAEVGAASEFPVIIVIWRWILEEGFMAKETKDKTVLSHIDQLVKEEERLYAKGQLSAGDQERMAELKVELDQYWDLLRQRRALEEFGENPDKAKKRPAKIVENYEQ
jgi:hypothetical protein